jgi:hypothetical protein
MEGVKLTPAERLQQMLKKANRGVEVTGALEPSAIGLLKRCAPPTSDSQVAMSIEFKIRSDEKAKQWAKTLTGNENFPVLESTQANAAYVSKRSHSVELTTNATTSMSDRAMLAAGKAISWIEAAGGNADEYENWAKKTWGEGFSDAFSSYKLLLKDGWHKEVMMEHDKPESAAYSLYNFMSMVKAEFNNFPKLYFGEDAYVPWHKYAVALKAIGAINIAGSQHRDKLNEVHGKAMWFIPTKVTTRTMKITDFKLNTSSFKLLNTNIPEAMKKHDIESVRDLSDWTFYESMSILRKNLMKEDFFEDENSEGNDTDWVDKLILHAMTVRKRKVLISMSNKKQPPRIWESLAEDTGIFVGGQTVAINVYERKMIDSGNMNTPYVQAISEIYSSISAVYRALRERDSMVVSLGRHVKDVFRKNGALPTYSFLHKDYQECAVKVVSEGYRSARCDTKYKYAHIANHGVLLDKHRTLSSMITNAFGSSAYSDAMLDIIRVEESHGVFLEMTKPIIDVSILAQPQMRTEDKRKEVVISAVKKSIDNRFERHYRARIALLERTTNLKENQKARVSRKRYQFLLKYHKHYVIGDETLKTFVDWREVSQRVGESMKKFIKKSKVVVPNGLSIDDINPKTEEQIKGLAMTIDDEHDPEFRFSTALKILEKEIESKGEDLLRIKEETERGDYLEESYQSGVLPTEHIENFEEHELERKKQSIQRSEAAQKELEAMIDPFLDALLNSGDDLSNADRPKQPLHMVITEYGYTKDQVRKAMGVLDWNELAGQYERGELVINDITTAINNQNLRAVIDEEKLKALNQTLANM